MKITIIKLDYPNKYWEIHNVEKIVEIQHLKEIRIHQYHHPNTPTCFKISEIEKLIYDPSDNKVT